MRCLRLAVVLLAAAAGADEADFARAPPVAIVGFDDWRLLSGEVGATPLAFGYRFYLNPERPGIYSVMRYRLRSAQGGQPSTEKFMWVERPGQRQPIRCFELGPGSGRAEKTWREMTPDSAEYQREMRILMAVLHGQNAESRRLSSLGETNK
jgi:hypothetical protein